MCTEICPPLRVACHTSIFCELKFWSPRFICPQLHFFLLACLSERFVMYKDTPSLIVEEKSAASRPACNFKTTLLKKKSCVRHCSLVCQRLRHSLVCVCILLRTGLFVFPQYTKYTLQKNAISRNHKTVSIFFGHCCSVIFISSNMYSTNAFK